MILTSIMTSVMKPILTGIMDNFDDTDPVFSISIAGIGYNGQTLTSTVSNSEGSLSYQWLSNGANISGATSSTYTVTSVTEGTILTCTVTDDTGSVSSNAIHNWIPSDDASSRSWYDPSDSSTITETSNAVSQLDDKIGSNDLVQATALNQLTTGSSTLNSLNILDGDGDDFMSVASFALPANGSVLFIMLCEITDTNNSGDGIYGADASSDFHIGSDNNSGNFDGRIQTSNLGVGTVDFTGGPYNGPSSFATTFDFASNNIQCHVDGNNVVDVSSYTTSLDTTQILRYFTNRAGTQSPNGSVSEFVVSDDFSSGNRENLEGYLAHKYGLTANLPVSHPYKTAAPTAALPALSVSIAGIGYNGQTLTATPSNDIGAVNYQWLSNGSNISGATSSTYVVDSVTEGTILTCQATDSVGSATSNEIHNWIPSDDSMAISWHDPSDSSTITESASLVSQLDDKIGSFDLVQGTAADQMTTGIRSQNGLNLLDGDGTEYMKVDSYTLPSSGDALFILLGISDSAAANGSGFYAVDAASADFQLQAGPDFPDFRGRVQSSDIGVGNVLFSGGPHNGPSSYACSFDRSATQFDAYVDGINRATSSAYTANLSTAVELMYFANRNESLNIDGAGGELIITEDVTTANRQRLEGYLAHKYNITANLDVSHPYKTAAPEVV